MPSSQNYRLLLLDQLGTATKLDADAQQLLASKASYSEVSAAGERVSSAYEYLRNAAENYESHLLLQRAIKRFFKRELFIAGAGKKSKNVANELRVELVQSGYVPNGTLSDAVVDAIGSDIAYAMTLYTSLQSSKTPRDRAADWVLSQISVRAEERIQPHYKKRATTNFALAYCSAAIDQSQFRGWPDFDSYDACLFIAIHTSLLKSDLDILRRELVPFDPAEPLSAAAFRDTNQTVDKLFRSELTTQLSRTISRSGAALRIMQKLVQDRTDIIQLLSDRKQFVDAYYGQIVHEYNRTEQRLDRGLLRSIVFLFITKVLVGVGIEIPFDLLLHDKILWLPLAINLLFPPLYMAALRLGLHKPSAKNSHALASIMESAIYDNKIEPMLPPKQQRITYIRQLIYIMLFAIPIAATVAALYALHFNVLQMAIFFVFFSTASSLGFRLGAQIRELEVIRRPSSFLTSIFDFFYLPFIVGGQWLSQKYSRLNLVARFLDIAIELPLKTVLRLIRQWIHFLDERREQLY